MKFLWTKNVFGQIVFCDQFTYHLSLDARLEFTEHCDVTDRICRSVLVNVWLFCGCACKVLKGHVHPNGCEACSWLARGRSGRAQSGMEIHSGANKLSIRCILDYDYDNSLSKIFFHFGKFLVTRSRTRSERISCGSEASWKATRTFLREFISRQRKWICSLICAGVCWKGMSAHVRVLRGVIGRAWYTRWLWGWNWTWNIVASLASNATFVRLPTFIPPFLKKKQQKKKKNQKKKKKIRHQK